MVHISALTILTINNKGYIYSIPPIDDLDHAAFKHDKGYDYYQAEEIKGALFDTSVADADFLLTAHSRQAMRESPFLSKKWIWAYGRQFLVRKHIAIIILLVITVLVITTFRIFALE